MKDRGEQAQRKVWFHVDLDGLDAIHDAHGRHWSGTHDAFYQSGVDRSLRVFAERGITATYFAIAQDLERPEKRSALQRIVAAGHHIASHAVTHPVLYRSTSARKRREVFESKSRLEDGLGVPVRGFRAPGYSIDLETLELLREAGYRYDSSIHPNHALRQRLRVERLWPEPFDFFGDRSLIELPLPYVAPWFPSFHPAYAFYLRRGYHRDQLRRFATRQRYLTYLFHLTDFSDQGAQGVEGVRLSLFTNNWFRGDEKERYVGQLLDDVREHFPHVTTSEELVRGWPESASDLNPRTILGIATTHETGACIVRDHVVVAAVNEERMSRIKLDTTYPPAQSIREVIRLSGVKPSDVDAVAVAGLRWTDLLAQLWTTVRRDVRDFHALNDYIPHACRLAYRAFYLWRASRYETVLDFLEREYGVRPKLWFVEHHEAHAACAHRTGEADDTLIVTADGVGDDLCVTIGRGRGGLIERHQVLSYPHSFGQFYTACTQLLGFKGGRHEGKITGLAGFGARDSELVAKVESTFFSSDGDFKLNKGYYAEGFPRLGIKDLASVRGGRNTLLGIDYRNYKPPLKRLLAGYAREDVAWTFQHLLEREMVKLLRPHVPAGRALHLVAAGGVFANVKLNMALSQELQPASIYIYPNMGDGGLCVGAALTISGHSPHPATDMYLGTSYDDAEIEATLAQYPQVVVTRPDDMAGAIAAALADHKIVARFEGRMEFGPRALGNRSILYHAGDRTVNSWLNTQLHRTEFMPFAPMCLHEDAAEYFHIRDGERRACEFMTLVVSCTERMRAECPAAVHVDGTARPQLVRSDIAPGMHDILVAYKARTGSSVVINTSFNMHEEPIIRSPDEAIRSFLASHLHLLAMGPFLVGTDASLLDRLTGDQGAAPLDVAPAEMAIS